jgi:CheY-like chemotaxis protein
VKRLVEMHGGAVSACSDGPGRGSTLTVRVPRLAVPMEAVATGPTRPPAKGARRLLLVEDSADVRRALHAWLELDGHEVHETADGITGLAEACSLEPDVAIIDIGLPGLDGWTLARRLRATDAGRRMILVAISGYGQQADQQRSRAAGFDVHLVKPVDLDALSDAIHGAALRTSSHA